MAHHSSRAGTGSISIQPTSILKVPTTKSRPYTGRSRPRTAATSMCYGFEEDNIICAITESRGIAPSVGLSFVNLTTSEAVLCQFADTQTFARACHKIKVFGPSQILFSTTAAGSKLILVLQENLEIDRYGIEMSAIQRRYWSEDAGLEYLQRLAFPSDLESLKLSVTGKYFAICCFAAVLRFVDLELGLTFAAQSLRIKFESSEGAMMIDLSTIANLELVQNLQNSKSKDSLFGLMKHTQTQMGARLLKSNILQPSTDSDKIEQRLAAVEELKNSEDMFQEIRDCLRGFVDTDKALAALVILPSKTDCNQTEQSVNHVLMLKTFVDSIKPISQSLIRATSNELLKIRELCDTENFAEVEALFDYALNKEVRYSSSAIDLHHQRVWAIRAGVNELLDVARQTFTEARADAENLIRDLGGEIPIKQAIEDSMSKYRDLQHQIELQAGFDSERQFFMKVNAAEVSANQLPEVFINIYRNKRKIEFQTLELVKRNQRIKTAHNEVINMSCASIQELINHVRSKIHPLFKISEALGVLDMLSGYAELARKNDYHRPEITRTLAIEAGRHPMHELIRNTKFVPNNVYSDQQSRFQIITGCNMSGKSTYIRSIALISIMAQMGCFVPAGYASVSIVHQLFARVSTDDSIEANVSTFSAEMREMAFILHNIEPCSLVIIDELGRGTSTADGLAIAIAISEALIESQARVWFVTHFRELPRILSERSGVVSYHMSVDIAEDFSKMKMKYKVSEGQEQQKFYGLALAQVVSLPQRVLDTAAEVSKALHERNEARKSNAKTLAVAKRRKLALKLKENLTQATESNLDNQGLRQWLKRLQEEFTVRMSAIDVEVAAEEASSMLMSDQETENTIKRRSSTLASSNASVVEQGDLRGTNPTGLTRSFGDHSTPRIKTEPHDSSPFQHGNCENNAILLEED